MIEIPYMLVDAFTSTAFRGNPASVCFMPSQTSDAMLQAIACEFNLSETAFLFDAGDRYDLRWFTPLAEVDLCGHATLAAAFALNHRDRGAKHHYRFNTRSGELGCHREGDTFRLNFPATPPTPADIDAKILKGLGLSTCVDFARSIFDILIVLDQESTVAELEPDFSALRHGDYRGIIVTSASDQPDVDFVSRFFAPGLGVDEDPVTGSAHCCLGPYWSGRLDRHHMKAKQLSKRGGELTVSVQNDRVELCGGAVLVASGTLYLP
jgi:PhzF family phenazine biosynthesis protein